MLQPDLQRFCDCAVSAAREAGELALGYFCKLTAAQISAKTNESDLVSIADREAEELIRLRLARCAPGFGFIGEESELGEISHHEYLWVVDPIDGTSNYLSGLPLWCVSIALCDPRLTPLAGVVHAPLLGKTWTATAGGGAWQGGAPICVRPEPAGQGLFNAMLATGFPYDTTERGTNLDYFSRMQRRFHKIRRLGSAAIDLAYIAEGVLDGMWELKLHAWDTAAGVLLVREAGGHVSRFDGAPYLPGEEEIAAASRPDLLALICAVLEGIMP